MYIKKSCKGSGEMVWWLKRLLWKHEDPSLNPKNSCKIWGREHVFVIPVLQQ